MANSESSVHAVGNKVYVYDNMSGLLGISGSSSIGYTHVRYALEIEEGGVLTPQGTASLLRTSCLLQELPATSQMFDFGTDSVISFTKESTQLLKDFLTDPPTTDLDALGILLYIIAYAERLPTDIEVAFAVSDSSETFDHYTMLGISGGLPILIYLNAAINYCTSIYDTRSRLCDLGHVALEPYASTLSWYFKYVSNILDLSEEGGCYLDEVPLYTLDLVAKFAYNRNYINLIDLAKLATNPIEGNLLTALHRQDSLTSKESQKLDKELLNSGYLRKDLS